VPEPHRRSPLEGGMEFGHHGAGPADDPGMRIAERRALSLVQVIARRGREEAVAERLALDPAPGLASGMPAGTALWLAPGSCLVVADNHEDGALYQSLLPQLRDLAAVIDQSHGRVVLRLAGPRARDVLAKGCRLDLHPRVFRPRMCAQTMIAHIGVLVHQIDDVPTYDLYVPAGFALDFLAWLTSSAEEFGYRIDAS
jgi:heterotetrameric sarcosine oxidase gamma subunit